MNIFDGRVFRVFLELFFQVIVCICLLLEEVSSVGFVRGRGFCIGLQFGILENQVQMVWDVGRWRSKKFLGVVNVL